MSDRLEPKPLCEFPGGATVVIDSLCGERGCQGRLCALGLVPGTTVVVKDGQCAACRLSVRDSELILGQAMAANVLAVPCNGASAKRGKPAKVKG